eukprot:15387418-Alexandrium_andersonii.AAC.1
MTSWWWPGSTPVFPGSTRTPELPGLTTWSRRCSGGRGCASDAAWMPAGGGASWPSCSRTRCTSSRS